MWRCVQHGAVAVIRRVLVCVCVAWSGHSVAVGGLGLGLLVLMGDPLTEKSFPATPPAVTHDSHCDQISPFSPLQHKLHDGYVAAVLE